MQHTNHTNSSTVVTTNGRRSLVDSLESESNGYDQNSSLFLDTSPCINWNSGEKNRNKTFTSHVTDEFLATTEHGSTDQPEYYNEPLHHQLFPTLTDELKPERETPPSRDLPPKHRRVTFCDATDKFLSPSYLERRPPLSNELDTPLKMFYDTSPSADLSMLNVSTRVQISSNFNNIDSLKVNRINPSEDYNHNSADNDKNKIIDTPIQPNQSSNCVLDSINLPLHHSVNQQMPSNANENLVNNEASQESIRKELFQNPNVTHEHQKKSDMSVNVKFSNSISEKQNKYVQPLVLQATSQQPSPYTNRSINTPIQNNMMVLGPSPPLLPNFKSKSVESDNGVNFQTTTSFKNILSSVKNIPRRIPFTPMLPSQSSTSRDTVPLQTAAKFSRTASNAGFLSKLGTTVPTFKRRFFVLKPTTNLYYFVGPDDTEPRGCLDLEGVGVRSLGVLQDGRFRFELLLDQEIDTGNTRVNEGEKDKSTANYDERKEVVDLNSLGNENVSDMQKNELRKKSIVLEARNEETGKEWIKAINTERLSHTKIMVTSLRSQVQGLESIKSDLDRRVEELRLVERDRDGAIQDASESKNKYEKLNEALGLLKRWISAHPLGNGEIAVGNDGATNMEIDKVVKRENNNSKFYNYENGCHDERYKTGNNKKEKNRKELEVVTDNQSDTTQCKELNTEISIVLSNSEEKMLNHLDLRNSNFDSLFNACQRLRTSLYLTSVEADTILEESKEANNKINTLTERIVKKEDHISKLWEENCSVRKDLKQKKTEKKILIKEVRNLRESDKNQKEEIERLKEECNRLRASKLVEQSKGEKKEKPVSRNRLPFQSKKSHAPKRELAFAEKKLIFELEEHVASSLLLHEKFLASNAESTFVGKRKKNVSQQSSFNYNNDISTSSSSVSSIKGKHLIKKEIENVEFANMGKVDDCGSCHSKSSDHSLRNGNTSHLTSPTYPTQVSLLNSFTTSKDINDNLKSNGHSSDTIEPSIISAEKLNYDEEYSSLKAIEEVMVEGDSDFILPGKNNFLDRLDEELAPTVLSTPCPSLSHSENSIKSVVTENGYATSKLICPLTDVTQSNVHPQADEYHSDDSTVYHLTFYTAKIGLQFQKVPASKSSNGKLTDAMTTDLNDNDPEKMTRAGRTAAELRRVAAISSNIGTKRNSLPEDNTKCPILLPKDIVLVCGFHGFDDNANNRRPSIGARLIAFDGISVEIGPWGFDSVRKAIQTSGRPLTLSFRNDFLTLKQRRILTKAVSEVESSLPPPRPILHYNVQDRVQPIFNKQDVLESSSSFRLPSRTNTDEHTVRLSVSSPSHSAVSKLRDRTRETVPIKQFSMSSPQHHWHSPHTESGGDSDTDSTISSTMHSRSSIDQFKGSWKTFSESGSSTVFANKFGSLMDGLMSNLSQPQKGEKFTPQYLSQTSNSLDSIPHHQQFKAGLL